jgi:hypothetical protein
MCAEDGEDLLAGYVSGPAAATEATVLGLARAKDAAVVVLVEGVSDQIAAETLARRYGRDLAGEGVVVLPSGGVHGIVRYWRRFGPQGAGVRVVGLCDAGEAHVIRRAVPAVTGVVGPGGDRATVAGPAGSGGGSAGSGSSADELAQWGFFVCVEDLEDELIRAAGPALVGEVFGVHGDLGAFRTMQGQPAWPGKDEVAQMRRFLAAGSQRKLRYARLLTEAIEPERVPPPLADLVAAI